MDIRSIDKNFDWQSTSPQFHHNHKEWDEDLDNDEIEQLLPQYAKIVQRIKDLEEQAFVTKAIYQNRMENKAKHNTPPMMMINTKIRSVDSANVVQTNESKIKHNHQPILLLGEHVQNIYGQNTIITPNSQPVAIISINKNMILLQLVRSLNKMYEMQ